MAVIAVVVSMHAAFINFVVDFIFIDVLAAPDEDEVKIQSSESAARRALKSAGRRLSALTATSMEEIRGRFGRGKVRGRSGSRSGFEISTTRIVPQGAAEAHDVAGASVGRLLKGAVERLRSRYERSSLQRQVELERHGTLREEKLRKQQSIYGGDSSRGVSTMRSMASFSVTESTGDMSARELLVDLELDIASQRALLKPSQRRRFDEAWGIEASGEFAPRHRSTLSCASQMVPTESIIREELKFVHQETRERFEKLRFASDVHTGIELLHLFVQDLLGRDSPAAKIWAVKCQDE
jgi:hypothetical protein